MRISFHSCNTNFTWIRLWQHEHETHKDVILVSFPIFHLQLQYEFICFTWISNFWWCYTGRFPLITASHQACTLQFQAGPAGRSSHQSNRLKKNNVNVIDSWAWWQRKHVTSINTLGCIMSGWLSIAVQKIRQHRADFQIILPKIWFWVMAKLKGQLGTLNI